LRAATAFLAFFALVACKSSSDKTAGIASGPDAQKGTGKTPNAAASVQPIAPVVRPPLAVADSAAIPAGAKIVVENDEVIDSGVTTAGAMVSGTIAFDVKGNDGRLAIPQGSAAVIWVLSGGRVAATSHVSLALYQVTINDKSYILRAGSKHLAVLDLSEDAAQGAGHRNVHLMRRSLLNFNLTDAIELRR